MERITVSRLQAAANRTAARSSESHSIALLLFRPSYARCETGVPRVAFHRNLCYTGFYYL
jgi:hypothetical protein